MPPTHYHNVNTRESFADLMDMLIGWDDGTIAIDIETTGLDAWAEGMSIVSLSLTARDEQTWVIPLDHPQGPWGHEWEHRLGEVADALKGVPLIAHNANFDLGWIRRFVPDVRLWMFHDTQTWAHAKNENRSKRLKSLAEPLMEGQWAIDVRDTKGTPWFTLAEYNAYDTIATMRLYEKQVQEQSKRMWYLHDRVLLPAQQALIEIEHRGMPLDVEATRERLLRETGNRDEAAQYLMSTALLWGMDPDDAESYPTISWEPTSKWFLAFTELAVEHEALEVQELTDTGRPSWRHGVLARQARAGSETAEVMLDYRDAAKKVQFIESWLDYEHLGRVHGRFNIARTRTGRLSSSEPNLQQVDRELKPLWKVKCEIDYSQVEMRVAAELIHRTTHEYNPMLLAFADGADLHSMAATLVTGGLVKDVTSEERQAGKAINFGFIFGMGAEKFVQYAAEVYGVEFTLDEAREVRAGYFDLWAGLGEWHEHMIWEAHEQGFVQNPYYRRRHLPDLFIEDEYLVSQAERQAINSVVQSTASDMMLEAIGRIEERFPGIIIGTVHDSVLLNTDDEEIIETVCAIMTNPSVRFAVPIEVEASIGDRWGVYDKTIVRSSDNG